MNGWTEDCTPPSPMAISIALTTKPGVAIPAAISEGNEVAKRMAEPAA